MIKPEIPDRSAEPALQESLDHGPRSTTASNSDQDAQGANPRTEDSPPTDEQETPRVDTPYPDSPPPVPVEEPPDDEEVEKLTGVPADADELSTI